MVTFFKSSGNKMVEANNRREVAENVLRRLRC